MSHPFPQASATLRALANNMNTVMQGQESAIRKLLAAFAGGGHVLLEDLPGTGKTTLAKSLAQSLHADFHRIQFTPDLLPSDILGVSIFNQKDQDFHFHQGPVFTDILLADEINRASPRVQSALLEAMGEHQVSLDGTRYALSEFFFVIATQNPVEFHGTYPLPEAQMDRFAMAFGLGYVEEDEEVRILELQQPGSLPSTLQPCVERAEIRPLKEAVAAIRVSDELKHYIVALTRATRAAPGVQMGASPRAAMSLMRLSQALALYDGEEFVAPEHIQELAVAVIAHRLKMDPQARFAGRGAGQVVSELLEDLPVPA